MSADYGYIRLHRCVRENPVVWDDRANRFQAWVDLLMLANYKDVDLYEGKKRVPVKRGTVKTSFLKLGARWGWDWRTAKEYVLALQDENMVEVKITNHGITINVVNYERYQGFSENDVVQNVGQNVAQNVDHIVGRDVGRIVGQNVDKEIKINKDKEKTNKDKRNNKPPISPFDELDKTDLSDKIKDCLREWFEYKKQKKEKSYQTEMGFKKFITQVKNAIQDHGEEKVISQFDYAMSRGWSGAYLDKIQSDNKQQTFNMDEFLKRYEE